MQGRSLKRTLIGCAAIAASFTLVMLFYAHAFGARSADTTTQQIIVTPDESVADIAGRLKTLGVVRYEWPLLIAYAADAAGAGVRPGGYELSASMDVWSVATALTKTPYLAWVTIPPGLRKEQIGDLLAQDLSWTNDEKEEFIATDTDPSPDYEEGVYYPDTYLIPSDQSPAQVADRLRDRFIDVFAPLAEEAAEKGIAWTDVVTLASLIEREAAGPDMALISGILWNRLDKGMALQVDASLQYIKGDEENGWWPAVSADDKYLDSPFNTYEHTGLPPHPIANPPLAALSAALNPATTSCLYYLHDDNGTIHCSNTYSGQVANVNKYLK